MEIWRELLFKRIISPSSDFSEPELFFVLASDTQTSEVILHGLAQVLGRKTCSWSLDDLCRLHPNYADLSSHSPQQVMKTIIPSARQIFWEGVGESLRRRQSCVLTLPASFEDASRISEMGRWTRRIIGVTDLVATAPEDGKQVHTWALGSGIIPTVDPWDTFAALRALNIVEWWHFGDRPSILPAEPAPIQAPPPTTLLRQSGSNQAHSRVEATQHTTPADSAPRQSDRWRRRREWLDRIEQG